MKYAYAIVLVLFTQTLLYTRISGNVIDNEVLDVDDVEESVPKYYEEKGRERAVKASEPSWYEDIVGADYFDEADTKKKNEDVDVSVAQAQVEPMVVTKKPYCTGCSHDIDLEDEKIKDIAKFAFETYSATLEGDVGENDPVQKISKIVKAEGQVVAGYKYIFTTEIGLTNCTKSQYQANPDDCVIDPTKGLTYCTFQVWEKSWENHKELLHSECDKVSNNAETIVEKESEISAAAGDDDYDIEVTTENQPGPVYQDFDDESAMKRKKRDTSNNLLNKNVSNFGRVVDAPESSEYIKDLGLFAIETLDQIDEDTDARLLVEVLNSKRQLASGYLYHLKIRVAQSTCKEGKDATFERCKNKIVLPFNICQIKILFQPWQVVQKKVTESQCYPEKMKKSKKIARKLFGDNELPKMTGTSVQIDPTSEDLQQLVNFAIDFVDASSNALHAQKLVKIVQAQRQVVSGVKTKLIVELGYTTCRKQQNLNKTDCNIDESRPHQFCKISVWEKPWLNEKKVTESKCGKKEELAVSLNKRSKRALGFSFFHGIDTEVHLQFAHFIDKFNRTYPTKEEYEYRLEVFKDNMRKVKLLNDNELGTATYGATTFADLTEEEFSKYYLGLRPDLKQRQKRKIAVTPKVKIPDAFDWRDHNVVTPVKNQGMCGSCWAFSVTGNIEGLFALKHQNLESFSEQELVDCDTLDEGCNGGLPENAYKAIQKLGGLETETEYPYKGKGMKCNYQKEPDAAQVTGFVEISKDEGDMAKWLFKNGPISIGINANAMQFYFGGVSRPWKFLCSPKNLDHGVLIVGYGVHETSITKKKLPYWLVKNSWGPGWGIGGYYMVYRGDGTCGVNQMATSAVIA